LFVIPAIDLSEGRCVRLIQGNYDQEIQYAANPLDVAKSFHDAGAQWIHIVDLEGARSGTSKNLGIVAEIARTSGLKVEFGGGVRSLEKVREAIASGITRAIVGTKLVGDSNFARELCDEFGEQVVAGIDARNGKVSVHGWESESDLDALEFAQEVETYGAKRIILTDILTDGMLSGPNVAMQLLYSSTLQIPVIASGGIGSLDDLGRLLAQAPKIEAVIVGRALYEGTFTLEEALRSVTNSSATKR